MEEAMNDLHLEIEELEQRVVPSTCSTLSVDVTIPDAADGNAAPAPSAAVHDEAAAADGADGVSVE